MWKYWLLSAGSPSRHFPAKSPACPQRARKRAGLSPPGPAQASNWSSVSSIQAQKYVSGRRASFVALGNQVAITARRSWLWSFASTVGVSGEGALCSLVECAGGIELSFWVRGKDVPLYYVFNGGIDAGEVGIWWWEGVTEDVVEVWDPDGLAAELIEGGGAGDEMLGGWGGGGGLAVGG